MLGLRIAHLTGLALAWGANCLAASGGAEASSQLSCGPDLQNNLIGRNGSIKSLEHLPASLQLKLLGASELSDALYSQWFVACGSEFMAILDKKQSKIRDIIVIPEHSRQSPEFLGLCERQGKETKYEIIAILENNSSDQAMLPAKFAKIVNVDHAKFEDTPTDNLSCPRDNIFTEDSGK